MKETQIHQAFKKWCDFNRLPYLHSRTDKRTTVRRGEPDFFVFFAIGGKWTPSFQAIEFKIKGGKLSDEQTNRILQIRERCGYESVAVCFSLEEAIWSVDTARRRINPAASQEQEK